MSLDGSSIHTQLLRRGDAVVGLRRHLVRVTVRSGPDKGLQKELSEDRCIIGTHAACDVCLTDSSVSRQHCEVALVPDGYSIRDLGSTNGTFIDRLRIRGVTVDRETRVRVGKTELAITPLSDTVDLPIAAQDRFGAMRGRSAPMRRLFQRLAQVATNDITVLLLGESGTGKELAAQAIHDASDRSRGPFVVVDCGTLSATLIESELYGHVRGAFTGADQAREGAFVHASGGTIFLDEIGELPLPLQSRLLGVLERREVAPLGGRRPISFDVRVVAATNRDLRAEVNRGTFREDLFFRLAVGVLEIPPLRQRPDDIPLYVEEFLGSADAIDAATMTQLMRQPWPGNVRELRNTLERATVLGFEEAPEAPAPVEAQTEGVPLTFPVHAQVPFKTEKGLLVEKFERIYLEALMRDHGGNISAAARTAEIDRVYLVRLLDKLGLRPRKP